MFNIYTKLNDEQLLRQHEIFSRQIERNRSEMLSQPHDILKRSAYSAMSAHIELIEQELYRRKLMPPSKYEDERALLERCYMLEYKHEERDGL